MKAALSRILEFFAGHGRRETDINSYCICGALKPEATRTTSSAHPRDRKSASAAS